MFRKHSPASRNQDLLAYVLRKMQEEERGKIVLCFLFLTPSFLFPKRTQLVRAQVVCAQDIHLFQKKHLEVC